MPSGKGYTYSKIVIGLLLQIAKAAIGKVCIVSTGYFANR